MERKQIAPAVYLNVIEAGKFNQCRVTVNFQFPASRQNATAASLLHLVLERGYADYPDMTQLSRRLAQLYGADLSVDMGTNGANRVLTFSVSGIKDALALEGEPLSREYAELVLGVAFRPYLVNGGFDPESVAIERDVLKKQLEAEVNNKRLYCVRQARRRYYGDSLAGVERDGYLEELDSVTGDDLMRVYKEILRTSVIDVMVAGADADAVQELLLQALAGVDRAPVALEKPLAMPRQEVQHYREELDSEQAKLCMLFTAGRPTTTEEIAACRLAMSLFGGSSTSRLFLNVREKESLCYYCGSTYSSVTGTMCVDSGIQPENGEKVEAAVLRELDALCNGPISEEELEDCRRGLLTGMDAIEDTLSSIESWYFVELCRDGALDTPAEAREALEKVTVEDVRKVLRLFTLSVSYFLTAKEAKA